jgi:glycine/D-amino acid oxidase-like deaminating enzyme
MAQVALHHQASRRIPKACGARSSRGRSKRFALSSTRCIPDGAASTCARRCASIPYPGPALPDRPHPGDPRVWIVSPCSGHGFKFATVIGEVVAAEVGGQPTPFDLGPFRLARFAS